MVVTIQQLKEKYSNYSNPISKISRDIKQRKLFPLVKGIYETNPKTSGSKLAQFIYGPSYLSFDYVLSMEGLIPEAVYDTFTCATFNKRKSKIYTNHFGTFIYKDVPNDVFALGVKAIIDGEYSFHVATAEKALCDKLYTISPVGSIKNLEILLFEDLRIDEDRFNELNKQDILELAPLYRSTNLNLLVKLIKKEKRNGTNT